MTKLQERIELNRIQIDLILNELPSDDLYAQEQAAGIVLEMLCKLESISYDERPKCDCCLERKEWAQMASNDYCLDCDHEFLQEKLDDNASYNFQCGGR